MSENATTAPTAPTAPARFRVGATLTLGGGNRTRDFRAIVDGQNCGHFHRTPEAAVKCGNAILRRLGR